MRKLIYIVLLLGSGLLLQAQNMPAMRKSNSSGGDKQVKTTIKPLVKTWRYIDDFTFADTLTVDTITTSFQIFNPIWRQSIGNITTGNLGAPYISSIMEERKSRPDFIFYNPLMYYFDYPEDVNYYNTLTPYVNLTFHSGQPKRKAEERIKALFTQNVNKKLNVGMQYTLISALGRYDAQKVKNADFRLFSSYDGDNYRASGGLIYTKATMEENGGIIDDDYILNPEKFGGDYNEPENIPVNFRDAENYLRSLRLYYNQSYNIGHLTRTDKDGEEQELPVTTLYHSVMVDMAKRQYTIGELPDYTDPKSDKFYSNIYIDSLRTMDLSEYNLIKNQFQIKFNEEANSLLRFGMRAFVGNEIKMYSLPAAPSYDTDGKPIYQYGDSTKVSSYIGGQIFKNMGKAFRWNAGMKFYFQGYNIGDVDVDGGLASSFTILGSNAELFANGGFYLRSPGIMEEHYFSNHLKWDNSFIREKTLKVKGGIRLTDHNLFATGSVRSINGYIFFGKDGLPDQNSDMIQVMAVEAGKHFRLAGINSLNRAVWQYSSNNNALPLPTLTLYSSNYYQNILFKVLTFQIGFDLRYHTEYYAPYYLPAIGQFIAQDVRKTGNYPFVDLFLNMHLKRARIYVKYDHVNKGWPDNNYFYTVGYPANPRSLKFGVSWNFYD